MALTLSLRFPMGRYVAAAWDNKDEAEWPPHPARLALAFVDVLHKAGNLAEPRSALGWLCAQPPPRLIIPAEEHVDIQAMAGFFVPQNPAVANGPKHPRKPRSFPSVFLDAEAPTVFFHWPEAWPSEQTRRALEILAAGLPRFGHSSSLVVATFSCEHPPAGSAWITLVPSTQQSAGPAKCRLRVPYAGLLDAAETAYDADGRAQEWNHLIQSAARTANAARALRPAASPRGRYDPRHRWQGYLQSPPPDAGVSPWDHRILVLAQTGGTRLGLISTWQLTEVFHKTLLDRWERQPNRGRIPSWLSGHAEGGGSTGPAVQNHLAIFPLPFVGHEHASGHLLGLAVGFPHADSAGLDSATLRLQWRHALSALFSESETLELTPQDRAWSVRLQPDESITPKTALQPHRWTRPSRVWTSVTPVVLDRHPKPQFKKDPAAWRESCEEILRASCVRIGLPAPAGVEVSPYSSLRGVPAAPAFPAPAARPGRPARFHIHATLIFDREILGPVLVGAGRFRGYGLMLPSSTEPEP